MVSSAFRGIMQSIKGCVELSNHSKEDGGNWKISHGELRQCYLLVCDSRPRLRRVSQMRLEMRERERFREHVPLQTNWTDSRLRQQLQPEDPLR